MERSYAPPQVRRSSLLLLGYALWVLVGTIYYAFESVGENLEVLIKGIVRVGLIIIIARWLLSLHKASWWLAVGVCSFFSLLGLIAIVALFLASKNLELGFDYILESITSLAPFYFFVHALLILVRAETRSHFGSKKA
jgi:hypothetical protein